MTDQHPITPPPELVREWALMFETHTDTEVFAEVGRWFADQELNECCKWLDSCTTQMADQLRAARRPKPPSLKEEALKMLDAVERCTDGDYYTIRLALEQLDD